MNENRAGINRIGRVGFVVSMILSIFVYLAVIALVYITIILHKMPDNFINITVGQTVMANMDAGAASMDSSAITEIFNTLSSGQGSATIEIGRTVLYLSEVTNEGTVTSANFGGDITSFSLGDLWIVSFYMIIYLIFTILLVILQIQMFKSIKNCTNPFTEHVSNRINLFSFYLVIWSFFTAGIEAILTRVYVGNLKIGTLGIVLMAVSVVFFLITRMYGYGATLYREKVGE